MTDTRYVYGARCTWHGPVSAMHIRPIEKGNTAIRDIGVPCCPHCGGPLFEYPNKATFDNMVAEFDKKHPGYIEFVEWLGTYGRCWPNPVIAADAYTEITGKKVQLGT